jgi:predicted MPP superfamily phosphohydrolase
LKRCKTCLERDKINIKTTNFITTSSPGEKVAFDILEINKHEIILVGIDYFTRTIFAKSLKNKAANKILEFIDKVNNELQIKVLICDDSKKFNNDNLKT